MKICTTNHKDLMQRLEDETSVTWWSGHLPTRWDYTRSRLIYSDNRQDNLLTTSSYPDDGVEILTNDEFVEEVKKMFPKKWKPSIGNRYYIPDTNDESLYEDLNWNNDSFDNLMLERGLVFQTKEDAIECSKRMLEAV